MLLWTHLVQQGQMRVVGRATNWQAQVLSRRAAGKVPTEQDLKLNRVLLDLPQVTKNSTPLG